MCALQTCNWFRTGARSHLRHLHHAEPGVQRARGAARQPQGTVPSGGDGGARPRDDRAHSAARVRLPRRDEPRREGGALAAPVPRAAQRAGPLRLRHARTQVAPGRGCRAQTQPAGRRRGRARAPRARRRDAAEGSPVPQLAEPTV